MIVIIDFGSQTTHLIARRIRDLGIEYKILDAGDVINQLDLIKPQGVILSGGPSSVYAKNSPTINKQIFKLNIPILAICYGWQLTAHLLGGKVQSSGKEYGPQILQINQQIPLLKGIDDQKFQVWMSHGDSVVKLPKGFDYIGKTKQVKAGLVVNEKRRIYGLQFHPEVSHTQFGDVMLSNFVHHICGLKIQPRTVKLDQVLTKIEKMIKDYDQYKAIAAVSGGIDSTVASALIARVFRTKFVPIYCDNGLMRKDTTEQVKYIFNDLLKVKPMIIDCKQQFLKALKGVTNPKQKRKIVGKLFVDVFEKQALRIDKAKYLIQGTIYSDVIESQGTKNSSQIRIHHNVAGLPKEMTLKVVEPVRDFYKDEVRELARQLGFPDEIVNKQPYPGPGAAIRIVGEVTNQRLQQQLQADQIITQVLKETGWFGKVFQSFPVMTNVNTSGVKGDERYYGELVGLRIYDSKDVMTAGWSRLPYEILEQIATRIVNEVTGVSRVAYDITTKPPATMEWM